MTPQELVGIITLTIIAGIALQIHILRMLSRKNKDDNESK